MAPHENPERTRRRQQCETVVHPGTHREPGERRVGHGIEEERCENDRKQNSVANDRANSQARNHAGGGVKQQIRERKRQADLLHDGEIDRVERFLDQRHVAVGTEPGAGQNRVGVTDVVQTIVRR